MKVYQGEVSGIRAAEPMSQGTMSMSESSQVNSGWGGTGVSRCLWWRTPRVVTGSLKVISRGWRVTEELIQTVNKGNLKRSTNRGTGLKHKRIQRKHRELEVSHWGLTCRHWGWLQVPLVWLHICWSFCLPESYALGGHLVDECWNWNRLWIPDPNSQSFSFSV